jgi:NTE family protein
LLSKASGSSFPALFYSKKRLETKISFYIWSDTYKDSTSMKHYLYILFLLFLLLPPIHAQKVGLVLSGGGAKGLTHIGIIRALEENGISQISFFQYQWSFVVHIRSYTAEGNI